MVKDFSKLCTPAKIYFAIAVISCIFALFNGFGFMVVLIKLIFAFIWTYILAWLCSKGYKSISWFLVLLPYIIMLLSVFGIAHATKDQRNMLNAIQLQGPFGLENFVPSFHHGGRENFVPSFHHGGRENFVPSFHHGGRENFVPSFHHG